MNSPLASLVAGVATDAQTGWRVASLHGELDYSRSRELRAVLEDLSAKAGPKGLILDLTGVPYMDSTALATLVAVRRQPGRDGHLRLCGLTDRVQGLVKITQVDRVLDIFPNVAAALAK